MKKIVLLMLPLLLSFALFAQKGSDLIISEYVEGWYNNKALEIYNPTDAAINLGNYRITRYSNGNVPPPTTQWYVVLSGILQPYRTKVFVIDLRNPDGTGQDTPVWDALQARADTFVCPVYEISWALSFNGDDAVALEKTDATFIDIFGKIGERPVNPSGGTSQPTGAWTDTDPFNTGVGIGLSADHTLVRKASVNAGVILPVDKFNILAAWDSLPANTFTHLGWHDFSASPDTNAKPSFNAASYTFNSKIDDASGTSVGTVSAADPNNDDLKYYISAGNYYKPGSIKKNAPFSIDRKTGEIKVAVTDELYYRDYTLTIDVTDGTTPVSLMIDVTVEGGQVSGIQNTSHSIDIFPNPVENGFFRINSSQSISGLEVYNLTGKRVLSMLNKSGSSFIDVRLPGVHGGLYMLKLRFSDDTVMARKILVK